MSLRAKLLISLCITLAVTVSLRAQGDEDTQSWHDLQISVPLAKRVDLLLQGTIRIGQDVRRANEARGGLGLSFRITDSISFSPTYTYIESRTATDPFRNEHRISLRGTYKFPTRGFGLSHRSAVELRYRSSGNSWRYRPSLTFTKQLPDWFLRRATAFATVEPFYVSTTKRFSRSRVSIGISKPLSSQVSVDIYYMRQNDGVSRPGDLHVLGTSWKVSL